MPDEAGTSPEEEPQAMADEQTPNMTSAGPSPAGGEQPPVPEKPRVAEEGRGTVAQEEGWAVPGARGQSPEEEPQAMADEQTPSTGSGSTSPAGGEQPPVTEKPVATRRKISQYIVSVNDATGSIVKIEKMDEQTGKPREFTQEEYAVAYGFASYAAPYYAAYAASLYNPLSSPAVQAYVKGIADYLKALAPER
jgi:hypothetical protein